MIELTDKLLSQAAGIPLVRAQAWLAPLRETCAMFDITAAHRLADFLATDGHESASFATTREIWGPTPAQLRYERDFKAPWPPTGGNPKNRKAYELGNEQKGDGRRFCGRGLIQTTGRANYRMVRDLLRQRLHDVPDFEAEPTLLEVPRWAALSAGAFWHRKMMNLLSDRGDFLQLSIRVNGKNASGYPNGWDDRVARRARAQRILGTAA